MKPSYRFYRGCYRLLYFVFSIFYPWRISGKENIPEGAALVCANHSSIADPFLIALALGIEHHTHIIAKAELYKIPVISQILKKMGMIRVKRGAMDAVTMKATLGYFKSNERVVIFPEGTRVPEDDAINAKAGAVKIAEHAGVPLVPLYLPRRKPLFSKAPLVIGEPYYIEKQARKRPQEDYARLSEDLMSRIKALEPLAVKVKKARNIRNAGKI